VDGDQQGDGRLSRRLLLLVVVVSVVPRGGRGAKARVLAGAGTVGVTERWVIGPAWTTAAGDDNLRAAMVHGPPIPSDLAVVRADVYDKGMRALNVAEWGEDGACPACHGFFAKRPHDEDCVIDRALKAWKESP
jgi:hypothetical protein